MFKSIMKYSFENTNLDPHNSHLAEKGIKESDKIRNYSLNLFNSTCIARLDSILTQVVLEAERCLVPLSYLLASLANDVECRKNFHRVVVPAGRNV